MKFPKLVIEEAKALKGKATKEEIGRLNFKKLFPESASYCVYGQMTGNCWSDRAVELIEKCARRVYNGSRGVSTIKRADLNGSPIKANRWSYWSPIEVFIAREHPDQDKLNERLIQFIKGEIKSL